MSIASIRVRGLPNLRNTCYLNSILQILLHTPGFIDNLKTYHRHQQKDTQEYRVSALLINFLLRYVDQSLPDKDVYDALVHFVRAFLAYHAQFAGQQDQHEYLMTLFKIIHDNIHLQKQFNIIGSPTSTQDRLEYKALQCFRLDAYSLSDARLDADSKACYVSPITQMFSGQFHYQTECRNPACRFVSDRFETFRAWEFPLGFADRTEVDLLEAMTQATSVIQLDDFYECDQCHVKTPSLRRCTIWRLPEILVIALKRTIYYTEEGRYVSFKDARAVRVPSQFDIRGHMTHDTERTRYELYATGNHIGAVQSGHCTAYACDLENKDKWYWIDDMGVTEITALDGSQVYLLFYRRCL